jgi:hypothetical protein
VIRMETTEDGIVFVGAPTGRFAYIDHGWLPASSGSVPALSVSPQRHLAWNDGTPVEVPAPVDEDRAAALVLHAVAREAAAAVEKRPPGAVEVVGEGLIARQVRQLVDAVGGERPAAERPAAIVDMTGVPEAIVDATCRLADLGILVLVGERPDAPLELNLYPDVHLRGLTVVGVAPPLADGEFPATDVDEPALGIGWLARVTVGEPAPPDAPWYRVSA